MNHSFRASGGRPVVSFVSSARRGTTLIELMVVISVMLVAVSIFYQMVLSTKQLRRLNHENAVAVEAARAVIERMRNESFEEVYSIYNEDPSDDPGAPGSAVGHRFTVDGLVPLPTEPGGMIGEIVFPAVDAAAGMGGGGGAQMQGGGGGGVQMQAVADWQLREDFVDAELGMPRDLNGDSIVDDLDHSEDYLILPVRVRLRWEGVYGERAIELYTMIGEFRKS